MRNKQKQGAYLEKVICYKCGASLEKAGIIVVTETPFAFVAHATCSECHAQSIVTVTPSAIGVVPLVSDLEPDEIKKFLKMDQISYDEILDLHERLKVTDICKLLHSQESNLVKKQKKSEESKEFPL
jgi:cytochrome c551/c552